MGVWVASFQVLRHNLLFGDKIQPPTKTSCTTCTEQGALWSCGLVVLLKKTFSHSSRRQEPTSHTSRDFRGQSILVVLGPVPTVWDQKASHPCLACTLSKLLRYAVYHMSVWMQRLSWPRHDDRPGPARELAGTWDLAALLLVLRTPCSQEFCQELFEQGLEHSGELCLEPTA